METKADKLQLKGHRVECSNESHTHKKIIDSLLASLFISISLRLIYSKDSVFCLMLRLTFSSTLRVEKMAHVGILYCVLDPLLFSAMQ